MIGLNIHGQRPFRTAGLVVALALIAPGALAQTSPAKAKSSYVAPTPGPELQAALKKAEAGDPAALIKLADGGDRDAEYYAGVLFIFGGKPTAKNAARGCAYEQKASVRRADAMHLVGMCYASGASGQPDRAKAEEAYRRAAEMGFPKSKCALGQMLMADPQRADEGLALCTSAAKAGDVAAQVRVGDAYFSGSGAKRDHAAARKWYAMAAQQHDLHATRRLGEMYARGDGGSKDAKKAMTLWTAAEKAGDPLVAILVADQLFSELTGGRTPGPGTYAFKGGVPTGDIKIVEEWYQLAQAKDPRADVKARAKYALSILSGLRTGIASTTRPSPR